MSEQEQVVDSEIEHDCGEPPWPVYSEAPASLNAYCITRAGWHVQITLRDTDEGRLWNRFVRYTTVLMNKGGVTPKAIGKGNGYTDPMPAQRAASHPGNVEQTPETGGGNGTGEKYYDTETIKVGLDSKGNPQVEFWRPGRQHPEIKWNLAVEDLLKSAPWLAERDLTVEAINPTDGLTVKVTDPVRVLKIAGNTEHKVPCRVYYTLSEKLKSTGKPYEDIVRVEPR